MKLVTENFTFAGFNGKIVQAEYVQSGNIAWQMADEDGSPITTVSVNVPGLKPDELGIKTYSENAGMLEALLAADLVELPHRYLLSGFVQIPVCRIKEQQGMESVGLSPLGENQCKEN